MNRKARINYLRATSHNVERKKMYKAKKQWVVAGLSFLVATGLSVVGSNLTTHAASTNISQQAITSSAPKLASGSSNNVSQKASANNSVSSSTNSDVKPSASSNEIQHRAEVLHSQLVTSGINNSNNIKNTLVNNSGSSAVNNSASGNQTVSPSSASAKSSVASNSNANSSEMSVLNSISNAEYSAEVASLKGSSANSTNTSKTANKVVNNKLDTINYFTGDYKQGNYCGMNYRDYRFNKAIEFTDGTANSTLSDFISRSPIDIKNAQYFKFDNVNLSKVKSMHNMFNGDINVHSIDFGNNFDTSNVKNMDYMFNYNPNLKELNLGKKFNINGATNVSYLFASDGFTTLTLPSDFGGNTKQSVNMHQMFGNDGNLTNINGLNNLNTSNASDIGLMFDSDFHLQSLDLSHFNTKHVKDMSRMFFGAGTKTSNGIDINLGPNFTTSKALQNDGLGQMIYYIHIHSIKIPSGASFRLNNQAGSMTLYQTTGTNDANGKPYTFGTPADFSKGLAGTFVSQRNVKMYSYSDIYSSTDDIQVPNPSTDNSEPYGWQFVNASGQVSNTPVIRNGKTLIAPSYRGLTYKYNKATKSVEFVSGTATGDAFDHFTGAAPSNIYTAQHIKFDSGVNTSGVVSMNDMFQYNSDIQTIDMSNVDTSNVQNMSAAFGADSNLTSLNLGNNFDTSNVTNMSWMFDSDEQLQSLTLPISFNTSKVTNMSWMFGRLFSIKSLILPKNFYTNNATKMDHMFISEYNMTSFSLGNHFDTSKASDMTSMFSDEHLLQHLNLGKEFNTSNVKNMTHMFDSDYALKSLTLPSNFNTSGVSDMYGMFIKFGANNPQGTDLNLGSSFDTSKSISNNTAQDYGTHGGNYNGLGNMFANAKLHSITMPSTAKFNAKSQLGGSWYLVGSKNNQLEKDGNGNYITIPNAPKTNLMDSNSHTGTWVKNPNPQKVTNTIAFTDNKTSDLVGSTTINGDLDSDYTINQAPKGYSFVGNDNKITITDPSKKVTVKVAKSNATDNADRDVPVAPNSASADVQYQYNGKTVASDTTNYKGNDSQATDAGNNSTNISDKNEKGIPAGWHLANKSTNVPYDNGKHKVAIEPNTNTANVHYQYKGKTINSHKFSGNDSRATQAGNNSVNVTPTNKPDIPQGYHLANNTNQFNYDGNQNDDVAILPNHVSDTVDYQLNGKTIGTHKFGGNDYRATQAGNNNFDVTATNDPDMPAGYQLSNKDNKFNYDGQNHDVAIEATSQSAPVNYIYNGNVVSHGLITGNTGDKNVKPTKAPQGYHFNGTVNPYTFDPANAGNSPSDDVTVAPNIYSGEATLHIKYDLGNGNIVNGPDQHFSVNGQYGQSDMVVNSTQYCPMNDAYQDNNSDWIINFNDLTKNGSVSNDKSLVHTFTYDATEAPDLVVQYDLINQSNDKLVKKDIHHDVFTASQLGIASQDWVDGNTITLGTKKNGDTNKLDVINAPAGYHLVNNANGYDYQNAQESIQLEPNATVSGHPVVLMTMPTGNVAPNNDQSNNKPTKPASNASGSTSNAASISMNSNQLSSLAKEIGEDINVTVRPNVTNTTNTIDDTTLNSLASEIATNNQEISSLANKPANTINNVNYSYFDNLINNGVDKLTKAIDKDFKANLTNTHAQRVHKTTKSTGVKRVRKHIKWIMIMKPVKLYNKAILVGTKSGAKILKPNHEITLNVKDVYKVHNHYVFKINFKHHNYYITANHNYVRNAYLPLNHNIINRKVRVLNDVYGYRHKNYDKIRTYHKGFFGRVKNIVRLGHYNMTRIQLTNGLWISANKNFIKLV